MLLSLKASALTAFMTLGALALPGTAQALPASFTGLETAATAAQLPVEQATGISFYYTQRRHGPRYRVIRRGYPHYYQGYYYRQPYWQPRYRTYYPRQYYRSGPSVSFGLTFGGGSRRPAYRGGGGSAHVAWCRDRYRTYDVRSDTFIARAGRPRVRCRSPY